MSAVALQYVAPSGDAVLDYDRRHLLTYAELIDADDAGIDEQGGAVSAIERGYMQNAIAENAYRRELDRNAGRDVVVGVNKYVDDSPTSIPLQRIDQAAVREQIERVTAYKSAQDAGCVQPALEAVTNAAQGDANLLPVMKNALLLVRTGADPRRGPEPRSPYFGLSTIAYCLRTATSAGMSSEPIG